MENSRVQEGVEKLAFGNIVDVVRLVDLMNAESKTGIPLETLEELDLFNLSKFRKTRDGFEVEVFDRLKALQFLHEVESASGSADVVGQLYEAITQGAAKL